MCRKRCSNRPGGDGGGARYLGILILAVAATLLSPVVSRTEKDNGTTLFAYTDISSGNSKVTGAESAIRPAPSGGGESWADMTVHLEEKEGVYIIKDVDIDVREMALQFQVKVMGINPGGGDYKPDEAQYPFYLQLIFDGAPDGISLKKKFSLWFKSLWSEKVKSRQNILYVFGNRMPKESIVNPYPGGAIISIGDDRDVSRLVSVSRDIGNDYLLAFGKEMNVKLTKVVIGFEGGGKRTAPFPVSVSRFLLKSQT